MRIGYSNHVSIWAALHSQDGTEIKTFAQWHVIRVFIWHILIPKPLLFKAIGCCWQHDTTVQLSKHGGNYLNTVARGLQAWLTRSLFAIVGHKQVINADGVIQV